MKNKVAMIQMVKLSGLGNLNVHESWEFCSEDYSCQKCEMLIHVLNIYPFLRLHIIITDPPLEPCLIT